jgi:hypothetical protein
MANPMKNSRPAKIFAVRAAAPVLGMTGRPSIRMHCVKRALQEVR